jgi:DNA-binding MarR family transcriptional regulator
VIVRLARRLRREVTSDATPSALSALSTLDRDGPMTLGRLAASEGVRPPTMTRIVARLDSQNSGVSSCFVLKSKPRADSHFP